MITLRSYLQGEWRDGQGEGATLVNPATEAPVGRASTAGLDLGAAVAWGREVGGRNLRALTFAERGALLKAMSAALHEAREALIEASIVNAGTTRGDSKFDIDGATGTLAYYARLGETLGNRRFLVEGEGEQLTRSARFWGHHLKVPRRGVAVHVNAFNFPAWGLAEKAAVALLAGVPIITKPATATALLAFRCMETIVASGVLPEGAMQMVTGGAGDLLTHLGPQDLLAFTGGGTTGASLRAMSNVVQSSVRVNIEADSLNATVLAPDVEPGSDTWQMLVRDVVREMTQKTGQKCTATRRVCVPSALADRLRSDLAEELGRVKIGDPANDEVRMGPLATAQQLRDVRDGIRRLTAAGAKVVFGSATECATIGVPEGKGYFVGPMLLQHDDPAQGGEVHTHEVFGPVSTLLPYGAVEEAVELVARGGGGLVASVYGDDREALETLLLGLAPWSGRVLVGSKKVADQAIAPGLVLPSCVHGGPGRAGGGEELGGLRGLDFYMQRTAVQGDRALLDRVLGVK